MRNEAIRCPGGGSTHRVATAQADLRISDCNGQTPPSFERVDEISLSRGQTPVRPRKEYRVQEPLLAQEVKPQGRRARAAIWLAARLRLIQ
jgi:hypothetical protein